MKWPVDDLSLRGRALSRWLAVVALSTAAAAGCSQPESDGLSSTLQVPATPGDGYSLLRAADIDHQIERIAVSGDYLFFTMFWHGVYAMPKYGGAVIPIDTDTSAEDYGLAGSPTDVVWIKSHFDSNDTPNAQLRRRDASDAVITTLKAGNLHVVDSRPLHNLQLGATRAFMLGEGFIEATPLAGGASTRVTFPWDSMGLNGPLSFQADDAGIYLILCPLSSVCWQDCGGASACTLAQGDPATGQSTELGGVSGRAVVVALDTDALYLSDGTRVWKRSRLDGSEVDLFAAEPQGATLTAPVAADADHLYMVAYGAPTAGPPGVSLLAIPKVPGAPATIGTDSRLSHGVWDLAVDDQFVFALNAVGSADQGNEVLAFPKTAAPSP